MSSIGRTNCAEYCPIQQWCSATRGVVPGIVELHDEHIEAVTIDVQEMDVQAAAEPRWRTDEQQAALEMRRDIGDQYLAKLVTSRRRAAKCFRLANMTARAVLGDCEQGPTLRRVPRIIGATIIGVRCRAPLISVVRAEIEKQMQSEAAFAKARDIARRKGKPDPSPLDYGSYLRFEQPEEEL